MENLILSTKNTKNKFTKIEIILYLLMIIMGSIFLFIYFDMVGNLSPFEDTGAFTLMWISAVFLLVDGTIQIYFKCLSLTSFIEVYPDRISGAAIQGFTLMVINLKISDINSITIGGQNVFLHTTSGKYKVGTDAETVAKILQHYEALK